MKRPGALCPLSLTFAIILSFSGIPVVHAQEEGADLEAFIFEALGSGGMPDVDADDAGNGRWPSLDNLSLTGYLKNETAYRYREPRSITKLRNIAFLGGTYSFNPDYRLVFSGWAYHDLAYDLFAYETISARFARDDDQPLVFIDNLEQERDSPVAEIRELYLDMFYENMDVRIGKQFVVWGVLEGLRITDEINPLDFRELILPDLLDYRIPLWTLRLDYYGEKNNYQFLWIPDIQFHRPAPAGSEWELLQVVPGTFHPEPYRFENSEVGVKVSTDLLGADVSFSYFYTWDNFPVIFRSVMLDTDVDPVLFPTHTRLNIYGTTLVKQAGIGVLKAEAAFVPDKYFGLSNNVDLDDDGFLDSQGVVQKRHIRWGLGYDFNMWGTDFSPAVSQWIILDYEDGMIQDEFDTALTLFARKPMPQHAAIFQLLAIGLINLQELFLKPKFIFNVTDHFQIGVGADLFFGERSQLNVSGDAATIVGGAFFEESAQFFGNFNKNDRVFMEFKYTF